MNDYFDFSTAMVRCSALYYVLCPGKNKTPKQQYELWDALLREEMLKYNAMSDKNQGMANGLKKAAKIAGIKAELRRLEPIKHEDPLPQTAKSYLKKLYGLLKYDKSTSFKDRGNKYTTKGHLVQDDALDLISRLDKTFYKSNKERIDNGLITGIPDTYIGEVIQNAKWVEDVKAAWEWDTFIEPLGKPLEPLYWWQMQGYLELTNAPEGGVSRCLLNCPAFLLEGEKYALARSFDDIEGTSQKFLQAEAELVKNLTFDSIPEQQRRLRWQVKRDERAIQRIHEVVPKCREYLAEVQELHLTGFFTDKELPILETIEEV